MEFEEWGPVYEAIRADFGYDRGADERARDALADLCGQATAPEPAVADATVAVAGAGPSLPAECERAAAAEAVFAASSAADTLAAHGVRADLVVTDLDKTPESAVALSREGTPIAVHAHGDNVAALREHVPEMAPGTVLPTTQVEPRPPVRNYGGFTDGDRAAFLADHLGAAALSFPGWDLDDPDVSPEKRRKLRWAERLLRWLELRRGERCALLDGRRDAIDVGGLVSRG
jgi:uncharacterized Rossmann fold enzyme